MQNITFCVSILRLGIFGANDVQKYACSVTQTQVTFRRLRRTLTFRQPFKVEWRYPFGKHSLFFLFIFQLLFMQVIHYLVDRRVLQKTCCVACDGCQTAKTQSITEPNRTFNHTYYATVTYYNFYFSLQLLFQKIF